MALSLAASLSRCGTFSAPDIACSYVYWIQSSPPDVGVSTRNALSIGRQLPVDWHLKYTDKEKESVHQEVLSNVKQLNYGSLSNGCLMRISPLAIFSLNAPIERVREMVHADCSLTHCEEDCVEAVFSYVMAIRELLNGKNGAVCCSSNTV
ncbi:unnamed protein product [Gongylonema pulchrum]|uniref:Myotubularin phosphatase domain-containing protein n=1 Tax=Gongylonema pulchrum TaxID=637853 RepID=A0A183CZX4_9BILA|nr:unnamed protein product [Gongylonema pulchrum]